MVPCPKETAPAVHSTAAHGCSSLQTQLKARKRERRLRECEPSLKGDLRSSRVSSYAHVLRVRHTAAITQPVCRGHNVCWQTGSADANPCRVRGKGKVSRLYPPNEGSLAGCDLQ